MLGKGVHGAGKVLGQGYIIEPPAFSIAALAPTVVVTFLNVSFFEISEIGRAHV